MTKLMTPIFKLKECKILLQNITNLKNVDERDIVMEIIKLTKINFKETLISIFNHILAK